jgi:hypothetical protein
MKRKLTNLVVATVLAVVLAPLRFGMRGPVAMRAWGALGGAPALTRGDRQRPMLLADNDYFQQGKDVGDKGGERNVSDDRDDYEDGDQGDHDSDHHHHRHHHTIGIIAAVTMTTTPVTMVTAPIEC